MKRTMKLLAMFFVALMLASSANAESPRVQLKQMVDQLQTNPADDALREKIIKLAQKLKPIPTIPEGARRAFVRGNTAFSEAKEQDDYARAVQRYEEAIAIAPWWGDPYFNLAKAQEMQQQYSLAIRSIKLFILTAPPVADVRKAQDYSYVLEDKQDKLTKERSEQEAAARADEEKYGWMLGRWHFVMEGSAWTSDGTILANKNGNQVEFKLIQGTLHMHGNDYPWSVDYAKANGFILGTVAPSGNVDWEGRGDDTPGCPVISWFPVNLDISSDHRTIKYEQQRRMGGACVPSGQDSYTLTHE